MSAIVLMSISPAKTAEPIEMPFAGGGLSRLAQGTMYYGGSDSASYRAKGLKPPNLGKAPPQWTTAKSVHFRKRIFAKLDIFTSITETTAKHKESECMSSVNATVYCNFDITSLLRYRKHGCHLAKFRCQITLHIWLFSKASHSKDYRLALAIWQFAILAFSNQFGSDNFVSE